MMVSKLHWTVQGSGSTHGHDKATVRKGETQVEDGDYERRRETSTSFVLEHGSVHGRRRKNEEVIIR
jgi:hypothetical protein